MTDINNNKTITILTITNKKRSDEGYELLKKEKAKIDFLNPKIVLIDDCESYADYNKRCVVDLNNYFDTDFCLIVQFDGKIINPSAWTNDFFNYDYVGAPWKNFNMLVGIDLEVNKLIFEKFSKSEKPENYFVGNGGFSLRSKKLSEILSKVDDYKIVNGRILNEDVFVCLKKREFLEQNGINFCPFDLAKRFSVEEQLYQNSFGGHKNIKIIKDGFENTIDIKNIK